MNKAVGRVRILALLLAAALLAACGAGGRTPEQTPSAAQAPETPAETAESPADISGQLTPGVDTVLTYERIIPVANWCPWDIEQVVHGWFAVYRDGKWGLIAADGEELLPCECPEPVCFYYGGAVGWFSEDPDYYVKDGGFDRYDRLLEERAGLRLMPDTGFSSTWLFTNEDGTRRPAYRYAFESYPDIFPLSEVEEFGQYYWIPCGCYRLRLDLDNCQGMIPEGRPVAYYYTNAQGQLLPGGPYEAVGWFSEGLAAVCRDGGWGYINEDGDAVTAMQYESFCYGRLFGDDTGYYVAETIPDELCHGYAVVRRNGKYGLIDASGAEMLPCRYDGLAQCGGSLWIREADGWHNYTLPKSTVTAAQHVPTGPAPATPEDDDLHRPDRDAVAALLAGRGAETPEAVVQQCYSVRVDADDGLRCRTGPSAEAEKIEVFPKDTWLMVLGSNGDGSWLCVSTWEEKCGWVSAEFVVTR